MEPVGIQAELMDTLPEVHRQDHRGIRGEAMDIVQPVPGLLVQVPAIVDDHQIQRPLRQEAAVHGVHILLPAEIPEIDGKCSTFAFHRILVNTDTQCGISSDSTIVSLIQNTLDGVGLSRSAVTQEDDLGFPDGLLWGIVVSPDDLFIALPKNTDRLSGQSGRIKSFNSTPFIQFPWNFTKATTRAKQKI